MLCVSVFPCYLLVFLGVSCRFMRDCCCSSFVMALFLVCCCCFGVVSTFMSRVLSSLVVLCFVVGCCFRLFL